MVPEEVRERIRQELGVKVESFTSASGGCINSAGQIVTDHGPFFLKWNSASRFPGMFEKEAHGLQLLFEANEIRIPKVLLTATSGNTSFLVMEYVERSHTAPDYWSQAGYALAGLHMHSQELYGLEEDNYIGSLPQDNAHKEVWTTFLIENRLEPQLRLALDSSLLTPADQIHFEALFSKLPNIIPDGRPSLLHGDLWGGNLITDEHGRPCLIDPAVYYGHREAEVAYTSLFGGFDKAFYTAYNEAWPLEPGFDSRIDLYNLYPLLVHVNLFGSGYVGSVRANLKRYL